MLQRLYDHRTTYVKAPNMDAISPSHRVSAFTKVHLDQVLLKSARDNCWGPPNIILAYMTRNGQRERIEVKGYVAAASLSRILAANDVTCALHAAACGTERVPIVI